MNNLIYSLLFPTAFISSVLISSFVTAISICSINNYSFFNPLKRIKDEIKTTLKVGSLVIINYNIIYFLLSKYNLYIDNITHVTRVNNIIYFIFLLEFFNYFYHRLSHSKYLYKYSHYDHHQNIEVFPIDFLQFDLLDNIAQTLYINLPLYFVKMHYFDYAVIYYIYSCGAFLIHSNIITEYHMLHHKYYKCNYGILLPIYDIIFGTYRK